MHLKLSDAKHAVWEMGNVKICSLKKKTCNNDSLKKVIIKNKHILKTSIQIC